LPAWHFSGTGKKPDCVQAFCDSARASKQHHELKNAALVKVAFFLIWERPAVWSVTPAKT